MSRFLSKIWVFCAFCSVNSAFGESHVSMVASDSTDKVREDVARMSVTADSLYDLSHYVEASEVMDSLLELLPEDTHWNYLRGACALYAGEVESAKFYLGRAQGISGSVFLLGDALMRENNYEGAEAQYTRASTMVDARGYLADACRRRLRSVRSARQMEGRAQKLDIADSVVVGRSDFFEGYDLTKDAGQVFLVSTSGRDYDAPRTGYMAERGDRMLFADTTEAGDVDIFQSNRLADGWGKRKVIGGHVNTKGDENFPFLSSDGMTLYFGSTRHGSIGGYDLFVSQFDTETGEWREPRKLSMPINSTWNDYLYAVDEATGEAWWATDRGQKGDSVVVYHYRLKEDETDGQGKWEEETVDSLPFLKNIHTNSGTPSTAKKVNFDLGNGMVYTDLRQFRSNDAMRLYNEGVEAERQYEMSKESLGELRRQYARESDKIKREEIGRQILRAERDVRDEVSKRKAEGLFERARQTEIRAINAEKR